MTRIRDEETLAAREQGSDGLHVHISQRQPIALDANLTCAPGELLALVGPSGAGKTSVLRAIAGLLHPSFGTIRSGGVTWFSSEDRINLTPQQRSVGFMFQDYALFPHLSAHDNVALAIDKSLPRQARDERTRQLLAMVNLEDLDVRKPAALSGGQRQRVALARALARDPDVLLLDEPFSAVDQMTRDRLKRELVALHGKLNIPIVLVTHDLDEALVLSDRLAVLYAGTLLGQGTPDDMRLRPPSRMVARLMGQTNVFSGEVVETASDARAGRLRFGDVDLNVSATRGWSRGANVSWMVASEHIVLHRRDRVEATAGENPVAGRVTDFARLGDQAALRVKLDAMPDAILNFKLPHRSIARNGIEVGTHVTVSLLADGIHLMAPDA